MLARGVYGGQKHKLAVLENYPGTCSILGPALGQCKPAGATQFGAEYATGNELSVQNHGALCLVKTDVHEFVPMPIVIATGAAHKKLGASGVLPFSGRGVSTCAVCDGAFFCDRALAVIGGGDSAIVLRLY